MKAGLTTTGMLPSWHGNERWSSSARLCEGCSPQRHREHRDNLILFLCVLCVSVVSLLLLTSSGTDVALGETEIRGDRVRIRKRFEVARAACAGIPERSGERERRRPDRSFRQPIQHLGFYVEQDGIACGNCCIVKANVGAIVLRTVKQVIVITREVDVASGCVELDTLGARNCP